ncbi:MAG: Uma2 family endonuclease [Acidobacteria bacterium]|nr:Uma2 family endonuclease [Acidobacteriota bacterium]
MNTTTLVSVGEYLATVYDPDRDYVDGETVERNMGETEHGGLQAALTGWLYANRKRLGIHVFTETRVQVKPARFRIPDICISSGARPSERILTTPPFLCIEILSPEDRVGRMHERIDDYLSMGVRFVWLIDPASRRGWVYTSEEIREAKDGVLRTAGPDIAVPIAELFD